MAPTMDPQAVQHLIEEGLPQARVRVASPDNTHFEALVVCESFAGKRKIQRHQMVYHTLGERVGREIHALSLKALTPEEYEELRGAAPDGS